MQRDIAQLTAKLRQRRLDRGEPRQEPIDLDSVLRLVPESHQLHSLQARMPVPAHDDVVMHGNAERRGDIDDGLGHPHIGLRGRGIAARMVMREPMASSITLKKR